MAATRYDIVVEQGADYVLTVPVLDGNGDPVATTGWTAAGQVRPVSGGALLHTLDVTLDEDGGGGGAVLLRIPASASAGWRWRRGYYDVEVTVPDQGVIRLIEGFLTVRIGVTGAPGESIEDIFPATFTSTF